MKIAKFSEARSFLFKPFRDRNLHRKSGHLAHLADEPDDEWRTADDENDDRDDCHAEKHAATAADVATAQVVEAFS